MTLLTKNSKMTKATATTFNFSLPAMRTCPQAGACKKFCYASKGSFAWPVVAAKHSANWDATKQPDFVERINAEIASKRRIRAVRIHDTGDFYSAAYTQKWLDIAMANPEVVFYAYTKSVLYFKGVALPANMVVVYSEGGKQDAIMDTDTDRHARIFSNLEDLLSAGYVDASEDDTVAWASGNNKIGLVAH